jgi:iron(III) transport system permease protein
MASYLPLAFPATFFGIGLIYTWNFSATQFIYSTSCILVVAYIARFIPFAVRIIAANLGQIHANMLEAAYLAEPSWLRRLWYIHLPLARKGLVICWIIVFIFSMGELGATLLVIPPGMGTISLKIYTLMHYGAGALVAALALILVVINLMVSLGMMAVARTAKV